MKRKATCILLLFTLTSAAVLAPLSANPEGSQIAAQARMDAKKDVSSAKWFLTGCLLLWLGLKIANKGALPPPERLMGKSPEYIEAYSKAYLEESRRIRARNAMIGCVGGATVYAILITVAVIQTKSCLGDFKFDPVPDVGCGCSTGLP
jgi:hypothetical protein